MKKICLNCKKEKPLEKFNFRNKDKGIYASRCKECTRKLIRNHYYLNKLYYINKAKRRNQEVRTLTKEFIWNYLSSHHCVDCGETDIVVLTFDHTHDKLYNVSEMVNLNGKIDNIKREIEKCEVRCANCHLRKTAKDFKWEKIMRL